jgi:hypothetical protein
LTTSGENLQPENKRLDYIFGWVALGASAVISLLLVHFRSKFVPAQFSFDSAVINQQAQAFDDGKKLALTQVLMFKGGSYDLTGYIVHLLHLTNHPAIAGYITVIAVTACIFTIHFLNRKQPQSVLIILAECLIIGLGTFFLGTFAKDSIIFIIFTLVFLLVHRYKWADVIIVVSMLAMAEFRTYWGLVAIVYILMRLITSDGISPIPLLTSIVSVSTAIVIAGIVVLNRDFSTLRTSVNQYTEYSEFSRTRLMPLFENTSSFYASITNQLYNFFITFVPMRVFSMGGAYYLFIGVLLIAVYWSIIYSARELSQPHLARIVATLASFITVQTLFEPDYGSQLRHIMPLLPLWIILLWERRNATEEAPQLVHVLPKSNLKPALA